MAAWSPRRWAAAGALLLACAFGGPAHGADWQPVSLSDSLGSEIDARERESYHLFPDLAGFERARFFSNGKSYRVEYAVRDAKGARTRTAGVTARSWEATRAHVRLVEQFRARGAAAASPDSAESQYRLAMRFASQARYDVSQPILEDLVAQQPQDPVAADASASLATIRGAIDSRRGLFLPGSIYDRSGRTDLMVFAGYYGIWTGIAIPAALGAEDGEAYAAGILLAPAASLIITHNLTRQSEIGLGRARMIGLGGNLGTWQGVGWSAVLDAEGKDVVGVGLLTGLAGIAAATALSGGKDITEAHGMLSNSAMLWGGWLGFVAGEVAELEDDDLVISSLMGSNVLVAGALVGARGSTLSRSGVRMIGLMGAVGTAFGFGIDLLVSVDSSPAAFGIAGAGTIAGLIIGGDMARKQNSDRTGAIDRAPESHFAFAPEFRTGRDASGDRKVVPMLTVRAKF